MGKFNFLGVLVLEYIYYKGFVAVCWNLGRCLISFSSRIGVAFVSLCFEDAFLVVLPKFYWCSSFIG